MAKTRLDDIEKKVDSIGFRVKIIWGLIIVNIGTVVLLRFL